ncbi:MAG: YcgN family cysteine cluster protein [Pseudomonadota bacterium]
MTALRHRFWESVTLAAMTSEEWEALCDGCAKCCLVKLEDADDGIVYFTDIHCHLLDSAVCRCRDYARRNERVAGCVRVRQDRPERLAWLPTSCSYRRLAEGRGLPGWHHLITGDRASVHEAGASIRGRATDEVAVPVDEFEDHLVDWPVTETGDG